MFNIKSKIKPNYYENIMNNAFQLVKKDLSFLRDKGKLLDSIGKKELAQIEYDKINNFYYVIYYFILIKMYIEEQIKAGNIIDCKELDERFNIKCIKDTVGCIGINISNIIKLFNFEKSFCILFDGINYDNISINLPINEIQ